MKTIEISMREYSDLSNIHFECQRLRKQFSQLDKGTQDTLSKVERYERALQTIAWQFGCVSPEPMQMRDVARKALYNKE